MESEICEPILWFIPQKPMVALGKLGLRPGAGKEIGISHRGGKNTVREPGSTLAGSWS